jgi:hypothetical protein
MKFGPFGRKKIRPTSLRSLQRRPFSQFIEQLEDRRMMVNTPPNLATINNATAAVGTELVIQLAVTDTETPAAETFIFFDPDDNLVTNATIDSATKTLRWTPTAAQGGQTFNFVVLVTDKAAMGSGPLADAETFSVTVGAANQPPVNTVPATQTVAEDTDLVFSTANNNRISIADPDAGTANVQVTLSVTNGDLTLPATTGLTFSAGDGTDDTAMTFTGTITAINTALDGLRYGPTANFNGSATLTIATNDQGNTGGGGPQNDGDTVTINVTPVADTPGVTITTTQEDTQTSSGLVVTRNPADDDEVTHVKVTGITNGTLFLSDGTTQVNNGAFVEFDEAASGFRFTPAANFAGTAMFNVQASTSAADAGLGGEVASVLITIFPVNDSPDLAEIDARAVARGQEVTFTAAATDVDQDTITFTLDPDLENHGATIDPVSGVFRWTPSATQALGPTVFRILATDDGDPARADSQTVVITVSEGTANQAPTFTSQPVTTATEDQVYSYSITATDPDGDDLLITAPAGLPDWLDLTDNQNGTATLTGRPLNDDLGPHNIVLQVDDGTTEATQPFTIIVSAINQAPVLANIPAQTGTVGTQVTFNADATDATGQVLSFSLGEGAPTGASIDEETGVFTWTPTAAGAFTVSVIVSDDGNPALTDQQDVTITVSAP